MPPPPLGRLTLPPPLGRLTLPLLVGRLTEPLLLVLRPPLTRLEEELVERVCVGALLERVTV